MLWQKIYNHRNERTWDFCLLENSHPWIYGETLKLSVHHLDIQVENGLNDDVLANIIPNNNGKPIKISQYYPWKEPKEINQDQLIGFRGAIIGYPNMQFSVQLNVEPSEKSNNSPFICDIVEIVGGGKEVHTLLMAHNLLVLTFTNLPQKEKLSKLRKLQITNVNLPFMAKN